MARLISHPHPEMAPLTRHPEELRILNEPLPEFLARLLAPLPEETPWRMDFIPSPALVAKLASCAAFELGDSEGPIAFFGDAPRKFEPEGVFLRRPWELLALHEQLVAALETDDIRGEVSEGVHIEGRLRLGEGSRLLPGVFIEGNVVIGKNCKIGPNCYLRGNTTIGDNCHVGQAVEIKNSLLGNRTAVGHLSYVGDSVLGDRVNFGAGTIIANLRHDGKNHRSKIAGELADTGRRKFGAIIGNDVHTGIHTAIYPGRKLWPGVSTRPGEIVQTDKME